MLRRTESGSYLNTFCFAVPYATYIEASSSPTYFIDWVAMSPMTGLEVETVLAEAIDDVSSSLTPQIATGEDNEVFHVEWDNLNKITTKFMDQTGLTALEGS